MSKRNGTPGGDATGDDDLVLERLRRHLQFLGLTHTLDGLDELLAWAVRERSGPTALLEHVLGAEAAHKLEQRIGRRIDRTGLREHKTLEAFDFDFQPKLDKSVILELARLDFVRRCDDVVITGSRKRRAARRCSGALDHEDAARWISSKAPLKRKEFQAMCARPSRGPSRQSEPPLSIVTKRNQPRALVGRPGPRPRGARSCRGCARHRGVDRRRSAPRDGPPARICGCLHAPAQGTARAP